MRFIATKFIDAYLIEPAPIEDERGFFARTFCAKEFEAHGLNPCVVQCNISYNKKKGTLRGMHYQLAPHAEAKLVSCIRGAIYDVIIDLRPGSATFKQWLAAMLSADNSRMLYVPEGFAHGFQTLEDDTAVFYQMSEFYAPQCTAGVRWDDAAIGIVWPETVNRIVSTRDQGYTLVNRETL